MAKRKDSAMGSSKYEFEPEELEKDIEDKRKVSRRFREDLENVVHRDYRYRNNVPMSRSTKLQILASVHRNFYDGIEG